MEPLLSALRAVAEPTRLRILAVLGSNELTVGELTRILEQSQPRVSRHLKVMCEAGLLERFREGARVFYRLSERGGSADVAGTLLAMIPEHDPLRRADFERVRAVRRVREQAAARYFQKMAPYWHRIRSLYVPESSVEAAMRAALGEAPIGELLDLGTGTGRVLEIFAPRARRAVGFDLSHAMLGVARARLDRLGIRNCSVRQGDLYKLPVASDSADVVTIHQVLHYLERPRDGLAEAARVLKPGGRLLIVDFAPHDQEFLREEHAHRRLGIAAETLANWCRDAGLSVAPATQLAGDPGAGQSLTVSLWLAGKQVGSRRDDTTKEAA